MNNHEFRQIIHSFFNLTGTQKRGFLDVVKSELNRTQTKSMIENIKGEVICFAHCVSTAIYRWGYRCLAAQTEARSNEVSGIIESDETFFSVSLEGNKTFFECVSRKRGKQGEQGSNKDKIKVLIVKERSDITKDYMLGWCNFLVNRSSKAIKKEALSMVFNGGLIQVFQSYNIQRYNAVLKGI